MTVLVFLEESTFATLPKTTRGVPIVLGGDPKGKNFLYANGSSIVIRNIDVSNFFYILMVSCFFF